MLDWSAVAAIGALLISVVVMFKSMFDKSLTIREHDEYRKGVERTTDGLQTQFQREIDKIEGRLNFMDQSKPSVGQLEDATKNLKEQLKELKDKLYRTEQ